MRDYIISAFIIIGAIYLIGVMIIYFQIKDHNDWMESKHKRGIFTYAKKLNINECFKSWFYFLLEK